MLHSEHPIIVTDTAEEEGIRPVIVADICQYHFFFAAFIVFCWLQRSALNCCPPVAEGSLSLKLRRPSRRGFATGVVTYAQRFYELREDAQFKLKAAKTAYSH